MDLASLALCLDVFDGVMQSPLGQAVESFLTSHMAPGSLAGVREKLIRREYADLAAYLADVESTVEKSIKFFSRESDVAAALTTIHQMLVERSTRRLSPGNRSVLSSLNTLTHQISDFAKRAPDTKARFKEFTRVRAHDELDDDYHQDGQGGMTLLDDE